MSTINFEQKQEKYNFFSSENFQCMKLSKNLYFTWACFRSRTSNFYVQCCESSTNGYERRKVAYSSISILNLVYFSISALVEKKKSSNKKTFGFISEHLNKVITHGF